MKTILESQNAKHKSRLKIILFGSGLLIFLLGYLILVIFSGYSNAAIDATQIEIGKVRQGDLIRDVSAPGNMVANQKRWVAASVNARVIQRILQAGARVEVDSVILRLSSPALEQSYKQAQIQLKVAEAQLQALTELQQTELHQVRADASLLAIEKQQAEAELLANEKLFATKIVSEFKYQEARLKQQQLSRQLEIAQFKLKQLPRLQRTLLKVEQAKVEQQTLQLELISAQVESLNVTAGMSGILQSIAVQTGQQVSVGEELAQIASQDDLKIELRVPESLVREVAIGQPVVIDTRRNKLQGAVSRIDPAVNQGTVTVDVQLNDPLPAEARPDLRVEGVIEIERLENVLLIPKPRNWNGEINGSLFKLIDEQYILQTAVTFGSDSLDSLQVVAGLSLGERIVLSDLARFQLPQAASSPDKSPVIIQLE